MMPEATIVAAVNPEYLHTNFISGFCNVIAGEQIDIAEVLVRDSGYFGEYVYGSLIHSKGESLPPPFTCPNEKTNLHRSGVSRIKNHCAWSLATTMLNFQILLIGLWRP
jgi:hypothetical protein